MSCCHLHILRVYRTSLATLEHTSLFFGRLVRRCATIDRASVKIKKNDPRNPAPSTLSQKNARSTVVNWHKPLSRADSDSETTMAEPELDATAPAPPRWLTNADQVEQKHDEAVAVAVAKCADETPPPL